MSENPKPEFVTNRELASEMRAMRWEMRALISLAGIANAAIFYGLNIPPVPQAVNYILGLF